MFKAKSMFQPVLEIKGVIHVDPAACAAVQSAISAAMSDIGTLNFISQHEWFAAQEKKEPSKWQTDIIGKIGEKIFHPEDRQQNNTRRCVL